MSEHEFVERPWGGYQIIGETETTLVKELTFTGCFIRPQRHHRRAEHWTLLEGKVIGLINDEPRWLLHVGDSFIIPMNRWHWFGGVGKVLEVWHGQELSEDDIEVRDAP